MCRGREETDCVLREETNCVLRGGNHPLRGRKLSVKREETVCQGMKTNLSREGQVGGSSKRGL